MKAGSYQKMIFCSLCFLFMVVACNQSPEIRFNDYHYLEPQYNDISITTTTDTLHFTLNDSTYNQINCFNYFEDADKSFISLYDRRSLSINIYEFNTQRFFKSIKIEDVLPDGKLYKISVFVRNFDSIYITEKNFVYLIDTSLRVKSKVELFDRIDELAFFQNTIPTIQKDGAIYMGVRAFVEETSFREIKKWRLLYSINLAKQEKELHLTLPVTYFENYYGDRFFEYSYCFNDSSHFVFSFPADWRIYVTDLKGIYRTYYGKSRSFEYLTPPVPKSILEKDNGFREYAERDVYGAIYYDRVAKRYWRLARRKVSEEDFNAQRLKRKETVIIFDEKMRVIAECALQGDFIFNTLFFTPKGKIYARVKQDDEYSIHFVRINYQEDKP